MGKFSSQCLRKCFPKCGNKSKVDEKQQTPQPQDTVPPPPPPLVENCTRTNKSSSADGIETFQEYVDRVTEQREKDSRKQKCRWLERITCCSTSLGKQQPAEPSFWIEPPSGYMERTYSDI